MKLKNNFLIFISFYCVNAFSLSGMDYCLRASSVIYDSPKGIYKIDFKIKLVKDQLSIPSDVWREASRTNAGNLLECDENTLRLITNGTTAHVFKFSKDDDLEFIKSEPYQSKKNFRSLGVFSREQVIDFYKDDKVKVSFHPNKKETVTKTSETTSTILHQYTNKLIKTDLKTGKQLDELIIFEGSRDETID